MIASPEMETTFCVPSSSQLLEEPFQVTSESTVVLKQTIEEQPSTTTTTTATTTTSNNSNYSTIMTSKAIEEISHKVEEVFSKLQRNLEHNTRIFQEKSQGLLSRIDQAEEQIRKVLSQLESTATSKFKDNDTNASAAQTSTTTATIVAATESIALSEETTKLEADETI